MQHPLRRLAILPIRFYQLLVSPILPPACRFHPTCSAYAMEAILRFGILRGSWLAIKRILRCHPWGGYGEDPVPKSFHFFRPPCATQAGESHRSNHLGQ